MTSLWTKLNDATQPGANPTKEAIEEIAQGLQYTGKEPLLYVLKRAQRLATMKGQRITTEGQFLKFIKLSEGNLAAQFGIVR